MPTLFWISFLNLFLIFRNFFSIKFIYWAIYGIFSVRYRFKWNHRNLPQVFFFNVNKLFQLIIYYSSIQRKISSQFFPKNFTICRCYLCTWTVGDGLGELLLRSVLLLILLSINSSSFSWCDESVRPLKRKKMKVYIISFIFSALYFIINAYLTVQLALPPQLPLYLKENDAAAIIYEAAELCRALKPHRY